MQASDEQQGENKMWNEEGGLCVGACLGWWWWWYNFKRGNERVHN